MSLVSSHCCLNKEGSAPPVTSQHLNKTPPLVLVRALRALFSCVVLCHFYRFGSLEWSASSKSGLIHLVGWTPQARGLNVFSSDVFPLDQSVLLLCSEEVERFPGDVWGPLKACPTKTGILEGVRMVTHKELSCRASVDKTGPDVQFRNFFFFLSWTCQWLSVRPLADSCVPSDWLVITLMVFGCFSNVLLSWVSGWLNLLHFPLFSPFYDGSKANSKLLFIFHLSTLLLTSQLYQTCCVSFHSGLPHLPLSLCAPAIPLISR